MSFFDYLIQLKDDKGDTGRFVKICIECVYHFGEPDPYEWRQFIIDHNGTDKALEKYMELYKDYVLSK